MIKLRQDKNLYGESSASSSISYTIDGNYEFSNNTIILDHGILPQTPDIIIKRNDVKNIIITSITLKNTTASLISNINFYIGHSLLYKELIAGSFTIPAYGSAIYNALTGWKIYDSVGQLVNAYQTRLLLYQQNTASATWTIIHNMNAQPSSIQVNDSAGDIVYGDLTIIDNNTIQIAFSAGFAGEARIIF